MVDCLINVFAKPYQTALSLLSLLKHSGQHIDRVFFTVEKSNVDRHDTLLARLPKIVHYVPGHWLWTDPVDLALLDDADYRRSIRYQYGWEQSDKRYVFITHNDCLYTGDIVGAMLKSIDGHIAVGRIGQCWNCPAAWVEACRPERYMEFRPTFAELSQLYRAVPVPAGGVRRPYHQPDFDDAFKHQPWPLPECRVNEWAALVDLGQARPLTRPLGDAAPFGAILRSGGSNLDVGVAWFRDMHRLGHRVRHFDVDAHVHHGAGHPALFDRERYADGEARARAQHIAEYDWPAAA